VPACNYLKPAAAGSIPMVMWYSLTAPSSDTADIVREELRIGRDWLVPKFNYTDTR
jgi:hypothetical protein